MLLALIVGIPFFVVSTSAPLLQKWFAYSGHASAKDPYFLYAASNLGSLLSLYFYPLAIEPFTVLQSQSWIWFGGYLALAACVLYAAYTICFREACAPPTSVLAAEAGGVVAGQLQARKRRPRSSGPDPPQRCRPPPWNRAPPSKPAPPQARRCRSGASRPSSCKKGMKPSRPRGSRQARRPSQGRPRHFLRRRRPDDLGGGRICWALLAAVPSSLMLGTTSYISTDLSPFPLVWIIPLALYLLSFILVYLHFWTGKKIFTIGSGYTIHDAFVFIFGPLAILGLSLIVLQHGSFDAVWSTFMLMVVFFAIALTCHGELAKDRPSTQHLTEYFLLMSVGGMVGGVFNGIIAPIVFQTGVLELNYAILVACFVRPLYIRRAAGSRKCSIRCSQGLQGHWVRSPGE